MAELRIRIGAPIRHISGMRPDGRSSHKDGPNRAEKESGYLKQSKRGTTTGCEATITGRKGLGRLWWRDTDWIGAAYDRETEGGERPRTEGRPCIAEPPSRVQSAAAWSDSRVFFMRARYSIKSPSSTSPTGPANAPHGPWRPTSPDRCSRQPCLSLGQGFIIAAPPEGDQLAWRLDSRGYAASLSRAGFRGCEAPSGPVVPKV